MLRIIGVGVAAFALMIFPNLAIYFSLIWLIFIPYFGYSSRNSLAGISLIAFPSSSKRSV